MAKSGAVKVSSTFPISEITCNYLSKKKIGSNSRTGRRFIAYPNIDDVNSHYKSSTNGSAHQSSHE